MGGDVSPFSNASTIYYRILEWDNNQGFRNLSEQPDFRSRLAGSGVSNNWIFSEGIGRGVQSIWDNLRLVDIDGNGTVEFVLNSGLPTSFDGQANGPWRAEISIFMWNGQNFLPYSIEAETPQFRFQAVQDADFETFNRNYDKALELYQEVISNSNFVTWSEQRREHEIEVLRALYSGSETPTPIVSDNKEPKNLVAYTYYRIMLLHILRGDFSEAQKTYETLQDKFPSNQDGHNIAEMAKEFWQEFLDTQKISLACSKVINFVDSHPKEFLNYIANVDRNYYIGKNGIDHGWQSEKYLPSDVCPFR